MLLSVVVYNHTLTVGQWLGAAVVFAGISVEAFVKRKGAEYNCYIQTQLMTPFRCSCKTRHPRKGKSKDKIIVTLERFAENDTWVGYDHKQRKRVLKCK